MAHPTLIDLANELLQWHEGAHEVLSDWLEEHGFGDKFYRCGDLHRRDGIACALLEIGAIQFSDFAKLKLDAKEQELAVEKFGQRLLGVPSTPYRANTVRRIG